MARTSFKEQSPTLDAPPGRHPRVHDPLGVDHRTPRCVREAGNVATVETGAHRSAPRSRPVGPGTLQRASLDPLGCGGLMRECGFRRGPRPKVCGAGDLSGTAFGHGEECRLWGWDAVDYWPPPHVATALACELATAVPYVATALACELATAVTCGGAL